MNAAQKRIRLKEILASDGCTSVPGVYDAVSAVVAQQAGFEALYIGSYATAASMLGLPDVGAVTLGEMASLGKHIANITSIPLIGDLEAGFYNAANILRAIRVFEDAGFSGAHIEDHEFGKHTNLSPIMTPAERMAKKIKAACDARMDKNFVILARTDTMWITGDLEDFVYRANLYLKAGADAVYVADPSKLTEKAVKRVKGPVTATCAPVLSVADETALGLKLSIYWPMLLYASFVGCREAAKALCDTLTTGCPGKYPFDPVLNGYVGFDGFLERVDQFMPENGRLL